MEQDSQVILEHQEYLVFLDMTLKQVIVVHLVGLVGLASPVSLVLMLKQGILDRLVTQVNQVLAPRFLS